MALERLDLTDAAMETYRLQSPDIFVVPQIPFEVQMIHELENEGKWMFQSGIKANERYETLLLVAEAAACQRFLVQPLLATFSERNTRRPGSTGYSPSRWISSLMRNSTCEILSRP